MTVSRFYIMQAAEGQDEALSAALAALADGVLALPGCEGVDLMQDLADATRFVFIEKWQSVEAHKNAGKLLPKALMAPVMGALQAPPQGSYLACLKTV